jgi:hypothetical protein
LDVDCRIDTLAGQLVASNSPGENHADSVIFSKHQAQLRGQAGLAVTMILEKCSLAELEKCRAIPLDKKGDL